MSGSVIETVFHEDSRKVLDLLDELRILGIGEEFPIPQIAVIGDQSSGKSSLLEALSGIPFPRGVGLVTRCPTCISMHKVSDVEKSDWSAEISITRTKGSKSHQSSQDIDGLGRVNNPAQLAERISKIMEYLSTQSYHGFSSDVIHVRVEASTVPDLTIIDLPGIIRTTTVGQNSQVISEVDSLLSYFMRQPRTIILAVVPANQDISTVDVLERAQRVDPMGSRTIGVLTKLDLVDEGAESETVKVVQNTTKPLALGYIMVKNRNQAQLRDGLSLDDALASEARYFSEHAVWQTIPQQSKGIPALSKKMTTVLVHRAQEALPIMKWELLKKLEEVEKELSSMGKEVTSDEFERRDVCLKLLSRFGQTLRQIATGDYRDTITQRDPELRIKFQIDAVHKQFHSNLTGTMPNFDSEEYKDILTKRIQDMRGRELPGFMSARLLLSTVSSDVEHWRAAVEEVFVQAIEIYTRAAARLIYLLAGQVRWWSDKIIGIHVGQVRW